MNSRHLNEIKGIIIIAVGLLIFLGLISYTPEDNSFFSYPVNSPVKNIIRVFGAGMSTGLFFTIGWISYVLPLILFCWGLAKFKGKVFFEPFRIPGIMLLVFSLSSLAALTSQTDTFSFARGGIAGFVFSRFLSSYFGGGAWVIVLSLALLSGVLVMEFLVSHFILKVVEGIKEKVKLPALKIRLGPNNKKERPVIAASLKPQSLPLKNIKSQTKKEEAEPDSKPALELTVKINNQPKEKTAPHPRPVQLKTNNSYQLPSLDLLDDAPVVSSKKNLEDDLTANAHILEDTLVDFGVSARVTNIERGPAITRYELEPAPGVKVQKIVSLGDDIALAMKAQSVRIVAPIPGKSRVGIEVPNASVGAVYLKEILASSAFQSSPKKLTLALGKDITGRPVVSDLGEMPHLLIAGTTGSGKTVCVNSLIVSLLYRLSPDELKFVMVDPKMVEMSIYNGLPHMLCPVVTDAKKASTALGWIVNEMEERYRMLAKAGSRNIEGYNQKQEDKLSYIVVVIDELADLMMVAANQIESTITRLAQLSRAVGIHLILATQRPSVDVITGVIKANFPSRISFKVASKVDSRTVLDANGADKLLGRGDLLFMRPGESRLIRAQGPLLKDDEIEKVVNFIKAQAEPVYEETILKEQSKQASISDREKDELFDEAARIILESNQASVSILQRKLMLGYTRAARIIDSMEEEGIVGPYQGSKPRKILVDRQLWLRERGFSPALSAEAQQEGE